MVESLTRGSQPVHLRLYVMSETPRSDEAFRNICAMAEQHLAGRYELEVIDVRSEPLRALAEGALMIPTLVLTTGNGEQRILGDLGDPKSILNAFNLAGHRSE